MAVRRTDVPFSSTVRTTQDFTVIIEPPFPPGWHMSPHSHIQYEVALVRSGGCRMNLAGESLAFEAGDAFFIPRGVQHGFTCSASEGVQFIVAQFRTLEDELVNELLGSKSVGTFRLSHLEVGRFTDICHRLQREIAANLPYAARQCEALKQQLVVLLLRSLARGGSPILTLEQESALEKALQWLVDHHHDERVRISDAARAAGMSPSHFRKLFQRYLGTSPKRYLLALRLQTSKCLMMQRRGTIAEVAYQSGFGSPQQFSKCFRQHTGLTPTQWRAMHMTTVP